MPRRRGFNILSLLLGVGTLRQRHGRNSGRTGKARTGDTGKGKRRARDLAASAAASENPNPKQVVQGNK